MERYLHDCETGIAAMTLLVITSIIVIKALLILAETMYEYGFAEETMVALEKWKSLREGEHES